MDCVIKLRFLEECFCGLSFSQHIHVGGAFCHRAQMDQETGKPDNPLKLFMAESSSVAHDRQRAIKARP